MSAEAALPHAPTAGPRLLLLALLALVLAGCGSGGSTIAACLNAKGFLVQEKDGVVRGSSPGGVNFTLTLYPRANAARRAFAAARAGSAALVGEAVVDFGGNPPASGGGAPRRLSRGALAAMTRCLARR